MANKKISELTSANLPLAGTEEIAIVQGGETKKVAISEVGGGGSSPCVWAYNEIFSDEIVGTTLETYVRTIEIPKDFLNKGALDLEIKGERYTTFAGSVEMTVYFNTSDTDVGKLLLATVTGSSSASQKNLALRRKIIFNTDTIQTLVTLKASDDVVSTSNNIRNVTSSRVLKDYNFLRIYVQNPDVSVTTKIHGYSVTIYN